MPTDVTITPKDRSAALSWSVVSGAQGYRVEWESDPALLDFSNPLNHGNLTHNLVYAYQVNQSGRSPIHLFAMPKNADGAPVDITITPGLRDNALSWSPVADAAGYRLYWDYRPGVTTASERIEIGAQSGDPIEYTHQNLEAGTAYHYVVTAVSGTGKESLASAEVGARTGQAPGPSLTTADAGVTIKGLLNGQITYTTSQVLRTGPTPVFPVTVSSLQNGVRYGFRIVPQFSQGLGPASARVITVPTPPHASVPGSVTLSSGRGVNRLQWNRVSGATAYKVAWFSTDAFGTPIGDEISVADPGPGAIPTYRHTGRWMCRSSAAHCATTTYTVRVDPGTAMSPEVGAASIDFRAFPPLVTNDPVVILTGLKPSGARVELNGRVIAPSSGETAWEHTIDLVNDADLADGVLRLVAFDATDRPSTEVVHHMTLDQTEPGPPTATVTACTAATPSGYRVNISGTKDAESGVLRVLEPQDTNRLLASPDHTLAWTATVDVESTTTSFQILAQDAAGNQSIPRTVTLTGFCP